MKISSRADYAAKAMLELSINPDRPVTLSYLSRLQNISISYLEQIFAQLRKHGLVKSVRGPGGGYVLNRPMAEITVGDVVRAIDNIEAQTPSEASDRTHALWNQLSGLVYSHLDTVSLTDIHHAANDNGVHRAA
ncbi:MAG TPA: Rrf2 family transcriptional regulator [Chromatiales bacterium]|nr:Rrf2 family transcriptional regulator [Chromatiales bacterium]